MRLRIVSRKSPLALWQAEHVRGQLARLHPGLEVGIMGVTTAADRFLDRTLVSMGGKGVFVKELEAALLDGRADIAVHSMKDVPVALSRGLEVPVLLPREDCRDVLVSNRYADLAELPAAARIGTSSLRRRSQLLALRPDISVVDVRGNVGTRLERLDGGDFDALLLAAAGLLRLGFSGRIRQYLEPEVMLPAIGQGVLGIECRADDGPVLELIRPLHDPFAGDSVAAERSFNGRLGGGCLLPVAGLAVIHDARLKLNGFVGAVDGMECIRDSLDGDRDCARQVGMQLAERMLAQGAARILGQVGHGHD
jgi:hydroxymethylbilane synthase